MGLCGESQVCRCTVLAAAGGLLYYFIEFCFKRLVSGNNTHWAMAVLGGLMFLAIGAINEYIPWNMPILLQGVIGGCVITLLELVAGLVLNVWLGLGVWDYSGLPFQFMGQISLLFTLIWVALGMVAVVLDDWLRHWLFGEEIPRYRLV